MAIKNLEEKTKASWKDTTKSLKNFMKLFALSNVCYVIFAFIFFYLEHCYDVVSPKLTYSAKKCLETCEIVLRMNQSMNGTIFYRSTLMNLSRGCQEESYCYKVENVDCLVNVENMLKWINYVLTIAFTLGEHKVLNYQIFFLGFVHVRHLAGSACRRRSAFHRQNHEKCPKTFRKRKTFATKWYTKFCK